MLVLTVNLGDQIRIGDHIAVAVKDINRAQVKLGIDAPKDVAILREELLARNAEH